MAQLENWTLTPPGGSLEGPLETTSGPFAALRPAAMQPAEAIAREKELLDLTLGLRGWAINVGAWTAVAVLFTLQFFAVSSRGDASTEPVWHVFVEELLGWWSWAITTPLIFVFAERLLRGRRFRAIPAHILSGLLFPSLAAAVEGAVKTPLPWHPFGTQLLAAIGDSIERSLPFNIILYSMVLAVYYALVYYREARVREIRSAQLETKLAQAQLHVLTMQLQPHFLFNTLHTISALLYEDVTKADRMIARLSDLLRRSLQTGRFQLVELKEELEFIEDYLDIQETRFADRLEVVFRVDPAALGARVPTLILQPIVENAIHHGIAARSTPGRIEIVAERVGSTLRLSVKDDGPGLQTDDGQPRRLGIGVANTRSRLAQLYGEQQKFEMRNAEEGGVVVTIELPYREIPALNISTPANVQSQDPHS